MYFWVYMPFKGLYSHDNSWKSTESFERRWVTRTSWNFWIAAEKVWSSVKFPTEAWPKLIFRPSAFVQKNSDSFSCYALFDSHVASRNSFLRFEWKEILSFLLHSWVRYLKTWTNSAQSAELFAKDSEVIIDRTKQLTPEGNVNIHQDSVCSTSGYNYS